MNTPNHKLLEGVELQCREGWFNIIDVLCEVLQHETDQKGGPQLRVQQVKENYGTLRFYAEPCNHTQEMLIFLAEEISGRTCEVCGQPGQRRARHIWRTQTLCDDHYQPMIDEL